MRRAAIRALAVMVLALLLVACSRGAGNDNIKRERDQALQERDQALQERDQTLENLVNARNRIAALQEELAVQTATVTLLNRDVASLTGEVTSLAGEAASLTGEVASLTRDVTTYRFRISMLERELAAATSSADDVAEIQRQLDQARTQLQQSRAALTAKEGELDSTEMELEATEMELASTERELESTERELASVRSQLAAKQTELDEVQRELDESDSPNTPTPGFTTSEAFRENMDALVGSSTQMLWDGNRQRNSGEPQRIPVRVGLDFADVEGPTGMGLPQYEAAGTQGGISLAEHRRTSSGSSTYSEEQLKLGGWQDYSFFFLHNWRYVQSGVTIRVGSVSTAYSVGSANATNPLQGSATWRGAMIGVETDGDYELPQKIQGNARLTIDDFSQPAVNVSFTEIVNKGTGRSLDDMTWDDLALTNGSFLGFHSGRIYGQFYGPNHEEVGGIFTRDNVRGAFGAARQ